VRVPLSWLRDYVAVDLETERLAERLTLLGMEVRGIERWGAGWRNVVVGQLLTVDRHPRADRLSLTTVDVGGGGAPLQIVCGATNIAPGQRVPVALPGAVLPGGREIGRAEKMGIVSNGMLCSGDELNLTTDADGIMILPAGTPLGVDLSDLYGDTVLDVDVKPNRGDALSLIGLAREVSAATGAPVHWPEIRVHEDGPAIADLASVDVREPVLCPRFVGRWVDAVSVGPSPDRIQMRLRAAGMRPISNVVDATNYVMLEMGKPTHAFDARAIRGGRVVVRRAADGEHLETLDHVVRSLDPETLVIADESGALAMAGIMGGADSEVTPQTRTVFVESAIFDPVTIRRTGQRYALRSEASLRFEKGQETRLARVGADRVAQLLAEWAGGRVAAGRLDTAAGEPDRARVAFRPARINRLLGSAIPVAEQAALLARVGIETDVAPAGTEILVSGPPTTHVVHPAAAPDPAAVMLAIVPTWRRDLAIEADVAEEIARVRGYEQTPGTLPATIMPPYRSSPTQVRDHLRAVLAGAGVSEVVTHALVPPDHDERLNWPVRAADGVRGEASAAFDPIRVVNPLSSQHSVLRRDTIGSLLDVLSMNLRQGREDVAIFEIGKGYGLRDGVPHEWWRLGIVATGAAEPRSWNRPDRAVDVDDLKGIVELLSRELGLGMPAFLPMRDGDPLHPGRAASVRSGGSGDGALLLAGVLGELHPHALSRWEIRADRVVAAELAISGLSGGQLSPVKAAPVPRFPAVERDLAVAVAADRPVALLDAAIRTGGGPLLRDVRLFDVYPLPDGRRSLAFRIQFQAPDRTLTEGEIDGLVAAVVTALEHAGGRLRA
jgi:phenylalanyl-tRNA synthetase beta chain